MLLIKRPLNSSDKNLSKFFALCPSWRAFEKTNERYPVKIVQIYAVGPKVTRKQETASNCL